MTVRAMSVAALTLATALAAAGPLPGQAFGRDEVDSFFRVTRFPPSAAQLKELDTLWRKIQIGAKFDRARDRRRIVEFGRLAVDFLERELLSDNAEDSRSAALALGRMGDEAVLEPLRSVVFGGDVPGKVNRRHAALALGQIGDSSDAARLLETIPRTKRSERQRAMLYALGQIADPASAAPLAALWKKEKHQEYRAALLLALGRIGSPEGMGAIERGLASRKESVRRAATLALADLRDPAHVDELRRLLGDSDRFVVRYALIGLALVRDPRVLKIGRLRSFLRDSENDLRELAVRAVGAQESEAGLALLIARLKPRFERHRRVRQVLAFALARQRGPGAGGALGKLREDRDPDVVRAALCASVLRAQGTLALLPLLSESRKVHEDIRMTAMELFAYQDAEAATTVLRRVAENRDEKKKLREHAREILDVLSTEGGGGRPLMRARVQVMVDDLGGSPEWALLQGLHQEFLRIEHIDQPISGRGPGAVPGGQRPQDTWTKEDEDIRIWYDLFPYFDRRRHPEVP